MVRERGRQIMEVSDAEGNKAMEATLTMLGDRITSLQTLADHKGKQLQVCMQVSGTRLRPRLLDNVGIPGVKVLLN